VERCASRWLIIEDNEMARYPVRCCCKPQKVLGYLEMPRSDYRNGETEVVSVRSLSVRSFFPAHEKPGMVRDVRYPIKFYGFRDFERGTFEIAVYSDDRPIEFWKTVSGFTPAAYHENGQLMFAADGMMLDENGNRSIFDDVDE